MTIQDLGSIGELLAAIATIATLIYLALQIRANTTVSRSESRRTSTHQAYEFSALIANDAGLASIFRRGLADMNALEVDEHTRFVFLFSILIAQGHSAFEDYEMGIVDFETFLRTSLPMLNLLRTNGGKQYWDQWKHGYRDGYISFIEQKIGDSSS